MQFISNVLIKILGILGKKITEDGEAQAIGEALVNTGKMLVTILTSDLTPEEKKQLYHDQVLGLEQVVQAAIATGAILVEDIPALLEELLSDQINALF